MIFVLGGDEIVDGLVDCVSLELEEVGSTCAFDCQAVEDSSDG